MGEVKLAPVFLPVLNGICRLTLAVAVNFLFSPQFRSMPSAA
jgi:hypothetical protein